MSRAAIIKAQITANKLSWNIAQLVHCQCYGVDYRIEEERDQFLLDYSVKVLESDKFQSEITDLRNQVTDKLGGNELLYLMLLYKMYKSKVITIGEKHALARIIDTTDIGPSGKCEGKYEIWGCLSDSSIEKYYPEVNKDDFLLCIIDTDPKWFKKAEVNPRIQIGGYHVTISTFVDMINKCAKYLEPGCQH